eukprot:gnl/TRDRNA2_/TRDRNA2_127855_c0_seq1.p1 gnl/TRDRNA2_/TRDRNA2_127855_c0~~gnl/TRDRNA2_/TRDRNA2_127855_c0_seq1.p1  ORF type:complete len:237 (+),score=33.26 gnl/TRDRNA2_/TRDRNA2_127855_c0_seq1:83-793(+)
MVSSWAIATLLVWACDCKKRVRGPKGEGEGGEDDDDPAWQQEKLQIEEELWKWMEETSKHIRFCNVSQHPLGPAVNLTKLGKIHDLPPLYLEPIWKHRLRDTREVYFFPDGSEYHYEIPSYDLTTMAPPEFEGLSDGTRKYIFPDGGEQHIFLDGTQHHLQPDGEMIDFIIPPSVKSGQRNPVWPPDLPYGPWLAVAPLELRYYPLLAATAGMLGGALLHRRCAKSPAVSDTLLAT